MSRAWIAVKPCGCLAYVTAIDPLTESRVASEVAKFMKSGFKIEETTTEAVREMEWKCETHRSRKKKKVLA